MKLTGKSCPPPDIRPRTSTWKWPWPSAPPAAESVFSFLRADTVVQPAAKPTGRLPAPKPNRFVVEEFGSELTVSYRWFTPALFFMVFFCLFWDGLMVMWYSIAISQILNGQPAAWAMAAFGLLPFRPSELASRIPPSPISSIERKSNSPAAC